MTQIIKTRLQLRRFTAAEWTAANEVLLDQEPGIETDTATADGKYKFKIGDGVTHWNDLPYFQAGGGVETIVAGDGIDVDNTDPKNPIVSSTLGGISPDGRVPNYTSLPSSGLSSGDTYYVESDGLFYMWDGTSFPASGLGISISDAGNSVCSIVQHSKINVAGNSGTLTLPSATVAGDVILIIGAGPYGINLPSGFSYVFNDVAGNNVVRCVAKVSTGGETSIAITGDSATPYLVAVCAVLRGSKLRILSGATATGHTSTQASPVTLVSPPTFQGVRKILGVIGGRRDSSTPLSPVTPSGGTVLESLDRTGTGSSNPSYSMKLVEYDESEVDSMNGLFSVVGPTVKQTFTYNGAAAYTLNVSLALN